MKNKLMSIIVCLITVISCFSLNGCKLFNEFEDEYFIYLIYENNTVKELTIVGLTDKGAQQEILVIPAKVNGYTVSKIGKEGLTGFAGKGIYSKSLKKIFLPQSITKFAGVALDGAANLKNTIILSEQKYDDLGRGLYVYTENIYTKENMKMEAYKYDYANIEFILNYKEGFEDVFWIDVEHTETFIKKHFEGYYSPEREGYNFAGWYKEPECVNEWDFENDKTLPDILDEETGETKKQVTRLYAKWNKN